MTADELRAERALQQRLMPFNLSGLHHMDTRELEREIKRNDSDGIAFGYLLRWGSCWIGWHWSPHNKRLCVNLIPFVTIWFVMPGGIEP